jgi:tRNA C32,U32 (ribose-2'-O)-methylase TrmJ
VKKHDDKQQKLILKGVTTSKQEIEDAERHLSKVLQDLGAAPRAQKTTVSGEVQTAFDRLRSARESLDELEKLIKADLGKS